MTVQQIADIVEGTIVCGQADSGRTVEFAFAADLMSDVLTLTHEHVLFITGLVAPQTIRTAVVSDIHTILIVRDKPVPKAIIDLAEENEISLIVSPWSMYRASGELYKSGLAPVF
ncbi:MAG: DRTGG domain-containing protein [Spirochaetota bacterium]